MKKKWVVLLLCSFLLCALYFAVRFGGALYTQYTQNQREAETEIVSIELEGVDGPEGLVVIDYPLGDRTPEHVAEVLGSWENYEALRDSALRRPTKDSMQIVYDKRVIGEREEVIAVWSAVAMTGRIIDIDIEGRMITIENEGDQIDLHVWEKADIYTENGKLEDLEEGDWLDYISVMVNSDRAEARVIRPNLLESLETSK